MAKSARRLLLFDDNIRSIGGHFLELASLLTEGAQHRGYATQLATHASFRDLAAVDPAITIIPTFRTRRMVYWSLGVDGGSRLRRDIDARPVGESRAARAWQMMRDACSLRERRPRVMLQQWSEDFLRRLAEAQPGPNDSLLINTGDDFVMLALARALGQLNLPFPLQVHVIFHFAVFNGVDVTPRARKFGDQVNAARAAAAPHHVHLHATTNSLVDQLQAVGVRATAVPYPTRYRSVAVPQPAPDGSLKMLMAGMPRAEKGRGQIRSLLSAIEQPFLRSGRYRMSIQMHQKRWKRMIPPSLHADYRDAAGDNVCGGNPLEIVSCDLSTEAYHAWLDTADLGMFLYDPQRYAARCSGVLLEMLVRGIPVMVPDQCWLADQIELAGGSGSVGYIYRSIDEIPTLLIDAQKDYTGLRSRATDHASVIVQRHDGANTLQEMGLENAAFSQRRMAS